MSSSDSVSQSVTQTTNQQTGVGAGGAGIGANSSHNIINVTTSDVQALEANQNVSETAINAEATTSAYALQALEQSQANANVITGAVVGNERATANDAENTAETLAANSQALASQVIAGAGYGSQTGAVVDTGGGISGFTLTGSQIALYAGIAASIIAVIYYYQNIKK